MILENKRVKESHFGRVLGLFVFLPDKYVGMLAAIRRDIDVQAAEVWMQSFEV